jgi:superfamily II RNA helicase
MRVTLSEAQESLRRAQSRTHEIPCRRCPHLRAHRSHHEQVRELEARIRQMEHEAGQSHGEYRRRTRALSTVLEELGFLEAGEPTAKGLLASRIYGENSLIITQAIEEGWLEQLSPQELAATLVMVTAEDRNRDRPRQRARLPTAGIALAGKRLRILYYRFSAREKERGEDSLRPLSGDFVNFAYDWCSGKPLTELEPEEGVEMGDAIKAIKGLYSVLRQMEWALTDRWSLRKLVARTREQCERDLITRI